jgi:hypothetical protein
MPNVRMKGSRFASIVYFVPISFPVVTHPAVDASCPKQGGRFVAVVTSRSRVSVVARTQGSRYAAVV